MYLFTSSCVPHTIFDWTVSLYTSLPTHAQFSDSRRFPLERALHQLGQVTDIDKLTVGNVDGMVHSSRQVSNMKQEKKRASTAPNGISLKSESRIDLTNIRQSIEEEDLEGRRQTGDTSTLFPGVVRKIPNWQVNDVEEIYIHTRNQLLVLSELSAQGLLVLSIDSTGNCFHKGDGFQHSKLLVQLTECLIKRINASLSTFHPFIVAERICPRNTAKDYRRWIKALAGDVKKLSQEEAREQNNRPNSSGVHIPYRSVDEQYFRPVIVKLDCADELKNGFLSALHSLGHGRVKCHKMYHRVMLPILLWHDGQVSKTEYREQRKLISKDTLAKALEYVGTLLKECDSHGECIAWVYCSSIPSSSSTLTASG